jgi:type I restriction enzyme S subunit
LIEQFNQQIKPLFKKLNINQAQIQTLETLRDNLLPKLMSGEVRVKYE